MDGAVLLGREASEGTRSPAVVPGAASGQGHAQHSPWPRPGCVHSHAPQGTGHALGCGEGRWR